MQIADWICFPLWWNCVFLEIVQANTCVDFHEPLRNHGTIRSVKRVCIALADDRPHSADMWAEHQTPTIIYEDNAACVAQVQMGYVKSNLTKHISPKFFYAHELQQLNEVRVLHTKSCDNLIDMFTKSLPTSTLERCVCVKSV